jgi:hypothetical protein
VAISSTRAEGMPQISPDGRRVALWSDRWGGSKIRVGNLDGSNAVKLTSVGEFATRLPPLVSGRRARCVPLQLRRAARKLCDSRYGREAQKLHVESRGRWLSEFFALWQMGLLRLESKRRVSNLEGPGIRRGRRAGDRYGRIHAFGIARRSLFLRRGDHG